MFRHDWTTLGELPAKRGPAAFFAFDLRTAVMSVIEMSLVAARFHDPRGEIAETINAWGDHVGHTAARGAANQTMIAELAVPAVAAGWIRDGYGASQIADFVTWAHLHGVRVIGGLPTGLHVVALPDDTQAAIEAVYLAHGGDFLVLANRSRYPLAAFFNTPLHLNEPCQIVHSIMLARALAPLLGRSARAPPAASWAGRPIRCKPAPGCRLLRRLHWHRIDRRAVAAMRCAARCADRAGRCGGGVAAGDVAIVPR